MKSNRARALDEVEDPARGFGLLIGLPDLRFDRDSAGL
jgi:hypothetical protein